MANLPISQLPLSTSGQPDSLMVIVNYDVVPSGETNSIYFSSLTQQFSGTSGSSGSSGTSGSSGSSGTSGSSGSSGTSPTLPVSLNYGLFTQTGDSTPISATTVETSLINGGIGTLTVPANGFSAGDTFRAVFGGVLNVGNNQTLRLRVKSGSVILADSGVQTITNITNDIWYVNIDFTVRKIGGPGTASIVSLGSFHYTKTNNGTVEGFSFNTINNTTFDTTSSNTLDVTVQWGSNNASNLIYSDVVVLNKVF